MLMGVMGHIGKPGEDDDEVARSIVDRLKPPPRRTRR